MDFKEFQKLLHTSKKYEMQGSCLKLTDYYTGKTVMVNLDYLEEKSFERILINEEDYE